MVSNIQNICQSSQPQKIKNKKKSLNNHRFIHKTKQTEFGVEKIEKKEEKKKMIFLITGLGILYSRSLNRKMDQGDLTNLD